MEASPVSMEPPVRLGLVCGTRSGSAGDQCQAKLIKPLQEGSEYWWVQIPGDKDEAGKQLTRIRELVTQ